MAPSGVTPQVLFGEVAMSMYFPVGMMLAPQQVAKSPQHSRVPSSRTQQEWLAPGETELNCPVGETANSGQQVTVLSARRPQVATPPVAISLNGPACGSARYSPPSPSPPQHSTTPSARRPQVKNTGRTGRRGSHAPVRCGDARSGCAGVGGGIRRRRWLDV